MVESKIEIAPGDRLESFQVVRNNSFPMSLKDQKIEELLKHLAAEFLQRESNRQSLVTVTGIELYDKRTKANILITVFPEAKQEAALDFARRKRSEFEIY
jgi:3-deoxy-D-arabino-heptulosonate 7-phosphate (DAHP) synthase